MCNEAPPIPPQRPWRMLTIRPTPKMRREWPGLAYLLFEGDRFLWLSSRCRSAVSGSCIATAAFPQSAKGEAKRGLSLHPGGGRERGSSGRRRGGQRERQDRPRRAARSGRKGSARRRKLRPGLRSSSAVGGGAGETANADSPSGSTSPSCRASTFHLASQGERRAENS